MNIPTPCFTGIEADEAERMGGLFAATFAARSIRPPESDEEIALSEALRRHPLRRAEYQRFRVRSDVDTIVWGHESRTYPAETVELLRAALDQPTSPEGKIWGVLDILAKSLLAGERAT